jgi:hypothetical protein
MILLLYFSIHLCTSAILHTRLISSLLKSIFGKPIVMLKFVLTVFTSFRAFLITLVNANSYSTMNDPITHYQKGAPNDSRSHNGVPLSRSQSYTNSGPDGADEEILQRPAANVNRSASYQDVRHEPRNILLEFDLDWVQEEDVKAFESALYYDPLKSPSALSIGAESGTEQIQALNDFAPVREKVSRKRKSKRNVKEDAGSPKGENRRTIQQCDDQL